MERKPGCACITSWLTFYKEITLFRPWEEQAPAAKQSAIPTSKERSEILIRFYNTYTYYNIHKNLLAFCSGSPAPLISITLQKTITFKNDNDIIVYAHEKIISFARENQYIFLAQSIWWISSIIRLQQGLIIYIDNLKVWASIRQQQDSNKHGNNPQESRFTDISSRTHPNRWFCICDSVPVDSTSEDSSSEYSVTSEDCIHKTILDNCEKYLQQSKFNWKQLAHKNFQASNKVMKQARKPLKTFRTQTEGIDKSELKRRKTAGKCQHCTWPQTWQGGHTTLDCFWWKKIDKGTAPFPKKYQHPGNYKKDSDLGPFKVYLYLGHYNPPTLHIASIYERLAKCVRNHTNCMDLWKLSKSACDQEQGKIECVFHIMRWCLSTPVFSK